MSFEDQKAKIRQTRYTAAAVIAAVGPALAIALREGGASNWVALLAITLTTLAGAAGSAVAARKTAAQRGEGMFAPPPPPPPAEETAISAVKEIVQNAADAQAVVGRVTNGITDVLGAATTVAAVTAPAAVRTVQDIADEFIDRVTGVR